MFISDIGLQFSFSCVVFVWIWYQGDSGLMELVRKCFFLCKILKEFQKDRHQFFSKCLIEFSCEAVWSWSFAFGRFLTRASISVLVIGLLIIPISSWFNIERLNFSKNASISFRFFHTWRAQKISCMQNFPGERSDYTGDWTRPNCQCQSVSFGGMCWQWLDRLPSKDLIQIRRINQQFYRQAKAERIQNHQTSSSTNVKGSSLDRKQRG